MHEEKRRARRGAQRHSRVMAAGRGDPRDKRRENQRLSSSDLDPTYLEIDDEGRITFTLSAAFSEALVSRMGGAGLKLEAGRMVLDLAPGLVIDSRGRVAVDHGRAIQPLKWDTSDHDGSDGTNGAYADRGERDGADVIEALAFAGGTAFAINELHDLRTIVDKINEIVGALTAQ